MGALASKNGKGVDPAPKVDDEESEAVDFWCDVKARGYTIPYDGEFQLRTNGYNLECEMEDVLKEATNFLGECYGISTGKDMSEKRYALAPLQFCLGIQYVSYLF